MDRWNGIADTDLLARLQAGDEEALSSLMVRHERRLYGIAYGYLRNSEDALEVVQDAFVKLFQHSATTIGGNSGGSILNDDGELIGTVTGGLRGAAISFAVPIKFTKEMIRRAGFAASVEGVEKPVNLDKSKIYPYGGSQ